MPPTTRQVKSLGPFGKGGLGGILGAEPSPPPSPCLAPPLVLVQATALITGKKI